MEATKNLNTTGRMIIVLFLVGALTALALGFINYITVDRIAELKAERTADAMREVLDATAYTELEYTGSDSLVATIYEAEGAGYVVEVLPSGFGGVIDMMVGIDQSGAVTGVSIIEMSETSGLGANASKEEFRAQFVGESGSVAVTKDGGTIDALTGATITSRAVSNGVNAALDAVAALG